MTVRLYGVQRLPLSGKNLAALTLMEMLLLMSAEE